MNRKIIFLETAVPECERLVSAASAGRLLELDEVLHRLKGIALYLHADDIVELIQRLEHADTAEMICSLAMQLRAELTSEAFLARYF